MSNTLTKALAITTIIILSGCATLPDPKYSDIAYKSEEGCHFIQYKKSWMDENISKIKWSGACVDGLMSGKGNLVFYSKQNPAEIKESYFGMMSKGTFDGFGKHTNGKTIRIGTFVDAIHPSSDKGIFYGRRFVDGKLKQDGEFDSNGNIKNGKIFFDNYYMAGTFDKAAKNYNLGTGEGIISGKYHAKVEFASSCTDTADPKLTAIQKQEFDDKCIYGKTLIEKPAIGGYFDGKVFRSIAALEKAQSDYAAAKAERERIEAAEAAERARVQAIADAERARVQAIADAERYRLQQIENVKQARYNQLRQPCTDARSEVASLHDSDLEALKITVTTLSVGAIAMAFDKNRDRVARYKRELESKTSELERQQRIFDQTKSRAEARADTVCQRTEQAVNNQRNQDVKAEANERLVEESNRKIAEYKKASEARARTKTDDPKVFGGGARGG